MAKHQLTSDAQVLSSLTMEQAALLEEESEYSYEDSEYMSDEEMLMQEFPDNPTYAQMLLEAVKSMNPKGASRQAIIKYEKTNYDMGTESSVISRIRNALNKLVDIELDLEEAEAELEAEFDDELDDDELDVEMDEDDFDDELDEDINKYFLLTNLIYKSLLYTVSSEG